MMWSADDGGGAECGGGLEPLGPFAQLGSRLGPLTVLQRRLDGCESLAELLAVASSIGPGVCGFERGVVLSVIGGYLTSNGMDALDDPASDALRHRCQVEPIALSPQSEEAEVIRLAQGGRRERARARSDLLPYKDDLLGIAFHLGSASHAYDATGHTVRLLPILNENTLSGAPPAVIDSARLLLQSGLLTGQTKRITYDPYMKPGEIGKTVAQAGQPVTMKTLGDSGYKYPHVEADC